MTLPRASVSSVSSHQAFHCNAPQTGACFIFPAGLVWSLFARVVSSSHLDSINPYGAELKVSLSRNFRSPKHLAHVLSLSASELGGAVRSQALLHPLSKQSTDGPRPALPYHQYLPPKERPRHRRARPHSSSDSDKGLAPLACDSRVLQLPTVATVLRFTRQ